MEPTAVWIALGQESSLLQIMSLKIIKWHLEVLLPSSIANLFPSGMVNLWNTIVTGKLWNGVILALGVGKLSVVKCKGFKMKLKDNF